MNQKNPKPTLGGQRIKTRKRDEKEKYDPLGFRDSVISGLENAGSDFEQVSSFLDNPGNKLNYRAYGEQLFEILIAGGLLAPGGSIITEGEKPNTSTCIFDANEDTETLRGYVQLFLKLTRRFKYLQKSFDDVLGKIVVFLKSFTEEQRTKLATVYAMILATGVTQGNFIPKLLTEHLVKEGISLHFITLLFQVLLNEKKDAASIISSLKKNEMDHKLLEFFPPNKRTNEQFEKHFVAAGLPKLVEFQKAQQHVGSKKEFQLQLREMVDAKSPLKEIISNCKEQKTKYMLSEEQVIILTWKALMGSVEWNKKEDLVQDQALRHLKVFLGMIYENENDADGIIKILQKLHKFVPCDNKDNEEPVYGNQGVVGDQLTVERAINGHMSLSNGFTAEERIEGLHFEVADWHAGNKFLEIYAPLLAEFTTSSPSELTLMVKVQEYCYDNMNFMKVFQKIILLLYKTDVISEDTVLKWYKGGHAAKGKSVFIEQMKKMVEWLQNAEEETGSEDEDED